MYLIGGICKQIYNNRNDLLIRIYERAITDYCFNKDIYEENYLEFPRDWYGDMEAFKDVYHFYNSDDTRMLKEEEYDDTMTRSVILYDSVTTLLVECNEKTHFTNLFCKSPNGTGEMIAYLCDKLNYYEVKNNATGYDDIMRNAKAGIAKIEKELAPKKNKGLSL